MVHILDSKIVKANKNISDVHEPLVHAFSAHKLHMN